MSALSPARLWERRADEATRQGLIAGVAEICPKCEHIIDAPAAWGGIEKCHCDGVVWSGGDTLVELHGLDEVGHLFGRSVNTRRP